MLKLNGVEITPTIFPDKTSQIWKVNPALFKFSSYVILWEFESEGEIMHLAQLVDLIRKCSTERVPQIVLWMPYLPYARQDKEISNESTFALRSFAAIIEKFRFSGITVTDAHSDVVKELFWGMTIQYPMSIMQVAYLDTMSQVTFYPDKGAMRKYGNRFEKFPFGENYTFGEKVRDPESGQLKSYELDDPERVKDKNVLIIDDICDGGGTFILAYKALKEAGAREVNLFTTHGLYTAGTEVLFYAGFSRIFNRKGEVIK